MADPPRPAGLHGWLVLDKPHGLGSTQAVAAVKRALRRAGLPRLKVGHGGTLDPLATGVLPIAIGEATKLAGRMLDASKEYDFTIAFGTQTDGLDAEGTVVASSPVRPSLAAIEAVLPRFTGAIEQVPPAMSALKIDGRRAHERARAGETVAMQPRAVTVFGLSPLACKGREALCSITLSAHVSKGTYIRSLARDIALAAGTVGHVAMLRRTRAGPFALDHAVSLDMLDQSGHGRRIADMLMPLEAALVDIPALSLDPEQAALVRQGRQLAGITLEDGLVLARAPEGEPVALMAVEGGHARVVRGFNLAPDVAEQAE